MYNGLLFFRLWLHAKCIVFFQIWDSNSWEQNIIFHLGQKNGCDKKIWGIRYVSRGCRLVYPDSLAFVPAKRPKMEPTTACVQFSPLVRTLSTRFYIWMDWGAHSIRDCGRTMARFRSEEMGRLFSLTEGKTSGIERGSNPGHVGPKSYALPVWPVLWNWRPYLTNKSNQNLIGN